jgi:ATP-dependent helicase HrpB
MLATAHGDGRESGYPQRERWSLDANRCVRVRIQILAPSNRPVQITENLGDFWRDTYPKLKQQLQRRYPKHEWR